MKPPLSSVNRRELGFYLLLFLLTLLVFCAILIPREIRIMKTISVLARYNSTRFLPFIGLLLIGMLSIRHQRLSIALTALVIFSSFALVLNGLWAGAYSENNVIAGLIPRGDAFSFYGGAVSLLESGYLVSYAKRRPLFGGFLAFLLWITGGNLQVTLAVLTYFLAAVTFFSVLEIKRLLSSPSAVLYFIVLLLFIRRFIGITMSENMGILLGISAFTFFLVFLRVTTKKKRVFWFLGSVLLFSFAQASRPGAIATLPLLILFAGWAFNSKKFSWKWSTITAGVVILGFVLNSLLFTLTTLPGGSQTNNLGFGIYGLAVGGKGWEQIFVDHPELDLLSGDQYEQAVFRIVWDEIRLHPGNFIKGMLTQFRIMFSFAQANSLYSFAWSKNTFFSYGLIALIFLLSLIGIIFTFHRKHENLRNILVLFGLGFLFSLAVAPAYQTRHMRVYAASLPFLGILPAIGTHFLFKLLPEKVTSRFGSTAPGQSHSSGAIAVFTGLFITFILFGPLFVRLHATGGLTESPACESGEDAVIINFYPGSSIYIYRNDPSITTWVPILSQLDYKGSIHNICCDEVITYFENIKAPNVLFPALNQLTGELMVMVVDESILPETYGRVSICGHVEDVQGNRSASGFLYPRVLQTIQE